MKKILIVLSAFFPWPAIAQQPDCSSFLDQIVFEPELRESATEVKPEEGVYSAPLTAVFRDTASTAASCIWSVYKLSGHETELHEENLRDENLIIRYTDRMLRYTFTASGSYRVKLEVADTATACICTVYFPNPSEPAIRIDDSLLDAPNVFSPGTSPGMNDEFRVAYRSIVGFRGWIFNRWGVQLFHWTDPDRGWDGKVNGKPVSSGVYFYVIEATGADGVKRSKKGHINVLRSKKE
jgi:gliding motility-associated-like protein